MTSSTFFGVLPSGTKSRRPVWPTSSRTAFGSETPGQLDDDAVGALGRDDRLRHAGRVHPPLDDLADDLEVLGSRNLVADLLRLVLDAEPALEVQAELGLDRSLAVGRRRVGDPKAGSEDDDEGGDADDEDEDGAGLAHRSRMIQGRSSTAAVRVAFLPTR